VTVFEYLLKGASFVAAMTNKPKCFRWFSYGLERKVPLLLFLNSRKNEDKKKMKKLRNNGKAVVQLKTFDIAVFR